MKKKFSKILGVGLTLALLTSLLLTAAPVSADVSEAEIDLVTSAEISDNTDLIITFDVNDELAKATESIEIRFPEGTILDDTPGGGALADADITVQTESTFGNDNVETNVGDDCTFTEDPDDVWTVVIDLVSLALDVSENSAVKVEFTNILVITNPDDPGMYTLEVRTSVEDDWVESEEYEIEVPDVDVLPGIVEARNAANILMDSDTGAGAIQNMLNLAGDGWTIKIGEGEYTEDPNTDPDNIDVTIEGSGDVEDIIIIGDWTVDVAGITIDGLTLEGDVTVSAADFTLDNCVVDEAGTVEIATGAEDATIDDTTFNVEDDVGVEVDEDDASITDCTFNVEEGGVGVSVEDGGIDTLVSDCAFVGSSGTGVDSTIAGAVVSVEDSTFDSLDTAIDVGAGTVSATGNTIEDCAAEAILVTTATSVILSGNTITGNDADVILDVAANADLVFMIFNTITDNDGDADGLLVNNAVAGTDLIVVNNWWGDAAGPAQGDDAFSDDVVAEPYLAGPVSTTAGIDSGVAAGTTADFEDDVGVTVVAAFDVMDVVAAAQYEVNPLGALDNAVGFWDVYVSGGAALDDMEIRFFTTVTEDTEVWVWGESRGEWLECTAYTPNLFSGFILVEADDTTGIPMIDDLAALPFAVVEPPAEEELDAPVIVAPESGATGVSLTPTFAWDAVDDADGYFFQMADNANFVAPLVKLDGDYGRLIVTAYAYVTKLPYSTPYYWRVKAVSGTEAAGDLVDSDWVSAVFVTMAEPEEPVPPVVIEPYEPPIIEVQIPPTPIIEPIVEVVTPPATPITPAWIYAIIGVGAVLVIAVIVLIVRTRRVA